MNDERENRLLAWIQRLIIERNEARKRCVHLARTNERLEFENDQLQARLRERAEQQQERK